MRCMEKASDHEHVHDFHGAASPPSSTGPSLSFGCNDCSRRHSDHCSDCVITYLCGEDDASVVVTLDDLRLVRRLQAGGLAPPLRYRGRGSAVG